MNNPVMSTERLILRRMTRDIPSTKVAERIGMEAMKTINKWGKEVFVYSVLI